MVNTKKSLIFSALSLLLCCALLAGTTFAWFTDSVTNTGNIITAGNLAINAYAYDIGEGGDSFTITDVNNSMEFTFEADAQAQDLKEENCPPIISDDLWEPGKSNAKLLKVENAGTLAVKIKLDFETAGDLTDALWFDFIQVKSGEVTGSFTKRPMSTLSTFAENLELPIIAKGDALEFILVYGMYEEAGNEYKETDFTANVSILATQYTYEKDGFGSNTYDENAALTGASVLGIAGYEGKIFSSVQEAYDAISPAVGALAGFEQNTASPEEFDNLFTNNGVITWIIYGENTVDNNLLFSFGRKSSYYGQRNITAINVIGGNDSAKLVMNVAVRNLYTWWGDEFPTTSMSFTGLTIEQGDDLAQLGFTDGLYGYKYSFTMRDCVINGKIYFYWNNEVDLTFDGCTFNNTLGESGSYALFVQGDDTGTVRFTGNTVDGYTRGVNFQRNASEFIIDGNTFRNNSERDRAALQLTTASKFTVTNNVFEDTIQSNAIWLWDGFNNAQTLITGNIINSAYSLSGYKPEYTNVQAYGNTVTPTQCWEKGAQAASECGLDLE